jgi:hypothetical protein
MRQCGANFLLGPFVILGNRETKRVLIKLPRGGFVSAMERASGQQHGDDHPVRLRAQPGLEMDFCLIESARIEERLPEAEERQFITRPLLQDGFVAGDQIVVGHATIIIGIQSSASAARWLESLPRGSRRPPGDGRITVKCGQPHITMSVPESVRQSVLDSCNITSPFVRRPEVDGYRLRANFVIKMSKIL